MDVVILLATVVYLALSIRVTSSSELVNLSVDKQQQVLGPYLWYLEDREGQWSINEVSAEAFSKRWQQNRAEIPTFGYTASVYWFSLALENPDSTPKQRLLEVAYPLLDAVDLYVQRQHGVFEKFHTGDKRPFSERPVEHRHFLFPITLAAHAKLRLYLRVQTNSALQVPLTLWAEPTFWIADQQKLLGQGLYFGIMLVMILYNLFIYLSIRDTSYIFYVLFVTSFALFQLTLHGIGYHYLWSQQPGLNEKMLLFTVSAAIAFAAVFTARLLMLKTEHTKLHRFFYIMAALAGSNALATLLLPYVIGVTIALVLSLVGCLASLATGTMMWRRGYSPARYYTIAWMGFLVSTMVFALNKFGVLPRNLFTENGIQIGSAIEVILLSFALANRINVIRKEKDVAQAQTVTILQRYRSLYENAIEGIFQSNLDYHLASANNAMAEMLGYTSPQQLLSEPLNDLRRYFADRVEFDVFCRTLREQGRVIAYECQGRRNDKRLFWGSWSAQAIYHADELIHYEGSLVNITLRKEKEQAEREREIANASAQAKSRFLATMSHEIRTPMHGILGIIDILRTTSLNSRQIHYVETVRKSGQHLLGIINDVLDFSKIEAGKLALEHIDFDVEELVGEVATMFAPQAHQKGLELIYTLNQDIDCSLCADPVRLRQILANLLSNAIKFTEQGDIFIQVSLLKETPQAVQLRFSVRDNGLGITDEAQAQVFDVFTQADGSSSRKYGGTGLGLAISKRLVQLMGGRIGVASRPGGGSTFWFTALLDKSSPSTRRVEQNLSGLGLNVLFISDNPIHQEIYPGYLQTWKLECHTLTKNSFTIPYLKKAQASQSPYDMVIFDSDVLTMDGTQFIQNLREDATLASLTTIILNPVHEQPPSKHKGLQNLIKPVARIDLYQALANARSLSYERPSAMQSIKPLSEQNSIPGGYILLVEDNLVNQEIAQIMLQTQGCRVQVVENGLQAVEAFTGGSYDLILMDCQMPELDGYETTRRIRTLESSTAGKRTPIIALTANAQLEDREKCLNAGMDDYMSKPFTLEQLTQVLARWMPTKRADLIV